MSDYTINNNKNELLFDGETFNLSEINSLLKKHNVELFTTITCPGEVKYSLSKEARIILKQLKEDKSTHA